jgi:hypothetical protein
MVSCLHSFVVEIISSVKFIALDEEEKNKNNNTDKRYSFRPCSVSLYLSLPRIIGLMDPTSPVRFMASTWSLPDRG